MIGPPAATLALQHGFAGHAGQQKAIAYIATRANPLQPASHPLSISQRVTWPALYAAAGSRGFAAAATASQAARAASPAANGKGRTVVLVESPAKARKIQGYLGDSYTVHSSAYLSPLTTARSSIGSAL